MPRYIGKSIPRLEDERFVTGHGRYTNDIRVVSPDVGGGFGSRSLLYPEFLLVVCLTPWTATMPSDGGNAASEVLTNDAAPGIGGLGEIAKAPDVCR
jgi:CO/xanthine dehydrogenase Mo-binding subunit